MPTTTVIPGTEHIFDTPVTSSPYQLPTPVVVGSGAVLADGSDSTYWDLGEVTRGIGGSNVFRNVYAQIAVPSPPLTAAGLTINVRADQTLIDLQYSDPQINAFIVSLDGVATNESNYGNTFVWSPLDRIHLTPNSGFTDYTSDLASGSGFGTLDDLVAFLNSGDAWLAISHFGQQGAGSFSGSVESRVSEFSISSLSRTVVPPLRLTNRDDVFGSARRVTGSRSRQGSNRLTGYL